MHKFEAANEDFLDARYERFKNLLLGRIEDAPDLFMEAGFFVSVLGGRICLQQSSEDDTKERMRFTEKAKAVK